MIAPSVSAANTPVLPVLRSCAGPARATRFAGSPRLFTAASRPALSAEDKDADSATAAEDAAAGTSPGDEDDSGTQSTTDAAEGEGADDEPVDELAALQADLEAAQAEASEHKDRALRTLAEMENVRRISQRDVENARDFAITKFAKGLLDVADNLTRAIESVDQEGEGVDAEAQPQLHTLLEGVTMTEGILQKAFQAQGLIKYGAEGESFDPHKHDAMFEADIPDKEPGTIAHLVKSGYELNGRVIRPAQVGTVKAQ